MIWHLRFQVDDAGEWAYHAGRAGFVTFCGAPGTQAGGHDEYADALQALMGQNAGGVWCPACAAAIASSWRDNA